MNKTKGCLIANFATVPAMNGEKKAQLAREFGISRETLYQYLKLTD
ncbi:helix-turn-helix domain-containing protein [Escherichia coli]